MESEENNEENIIERIKSMKKGDVVRYFRGHFGSQEVVGTKFHRFIMNLMYIPSVTELGQPTRIDKPNCDFICFQKLVDRKVSAHTGEVVCSDFDYYIKKVKGE